MLPSISLYVNVNHYNRDKNDFDAKFLSKQSVPVIAAIWIMVVMHAYNLSSLVVVVRACNPSSQRQVDPELETSLCYIVRLQNKKTNKKEKGL